MKNSNTQPLKPNFNSSPVPFTLPSGLSLESFWTPQYVAKSGWIELAPIAFWICSQLKPRTLVELGTHYGYSYFAFCQTVEKLSLGTQCYAVDTWKGDEHAGFYSDDVFQVVNQHNLSHYSAFSRLVRATFREALTHFEDNSIDLLHIDGRHFYDDIKEDYESWKPKLSERAIVLFHDTNVREKNFGVWQFFEELKQAHPHFEFLHGNGLGIIALGSELPESLEQFFHASKDREATNNLRTIYARLGKSLENDYQVGASIESLRKSITRLNTDKKNLESQLEKAIGNAERRSEQLGQKNVRIQRLEAERQEAFKTLSEQSKTIEATRHAITKLRDNLKETKAELEKVSDENAKNALHLLQLDSLTDIQVFSSMWKLGKLAPRVSRKLAYGIKLAFFALTLDTQRLKSLRAIKKVSKAIGRSSLFDTNWYLSSNKDLKESSFPIDATLHYVARGATEGRDPHPLFCTSWYYKTYPDVLRSKQNALLHFIEHGSNEGRNPNPLFDTNWYKEKCAEASITINEEPIILHYLRTWQETQIDPCPFFSGQWYLNEYPDVSESGINPLIHFLRYGHKEGRFPALETAKRVAAKKALSTLQIEKNSPLEQTHSNSIYPKSILEPDANIQIIQFTPPNPRNPYYRIMGEELKKIGWNYSYNTDISALLDHVPISPFSKTIIHFHQLEAIYRKDGMSEDEVAKSASKLLDDISELKRLGAKIIWTQHNPLPHDRQFASIDRQVIKLMSFVADKIIVLGELAKKGMLAHTVEEKLSIIHHPSFEGIYGEKKNREESRKLLSIDNNEVVFLVLGEIKPYKGIELVIDAFNSMPKDIHARLIIAGNASSKTYAESLLSKAHEKISIDARNITDEELIQYLSASDCSLFAFKDIWMSSSLVLSLSYDIPVIVPDVGCPPEIVRNFQVGYVYNHNDAASLAEKMKLFVTEKKGAHQAYMCREYKAQHSLSKIISDLAKLYKETALIN